MALDPNYLQGVGDDLEKLYQELGTEILIDIAKRIKKNAGSMTSTTEYLNNKLKELGLQQSFINEKLAEVMNTSEQEVERIMNESAYKGIRSTFDKLENAGYDTTGLEFGDKITKGIEALNGDIKNLTQTTAQLASDTFIKYYDLAYLKVASGAYSYDQAVSTTIDQLVKEGITKVSYPSGAQRTVEAAVRLAVRTAVNQTALACEKECIDELGINLVETSSHLGARPSHATWQGRVFWVNYPEGNYENFYEATGYGTGEGLGGYNCRHAFYPYFPEMGQTYGKEITTPGANEKQYENEQKQRLYERNMRKWDRERRVKASVGLDTTKEDRWYNYNKQQLERLVDNSSGLLKRNYSAEKIGGIKGQKYKSVRSQKKKLDKHSVIKMTKKEDLTGYKMDFAPKQDKHYPGTKLYEDSVKMGSYPSYFTIPQKELKEIILKYAQTGINQYDKNQDWQSCETILDCDKIIGYAVNRKTGAKIETKYFRIHYSKDKGFHAVPEFPTKGALKE